MNRAALSRQRERLYLYDSDFTRAHYDSVVESIDDVVPLWPSAQTAAFAADLGLPHRYPGGEFVLQDGGELVNSKTHLRALPISASTPVVPGQVYRT